MRTCLLCGTAHETTGCPQPRQTKDFDALQALYIQQLNTRKLMAEVIAEYAKHDSWRCDYYRECHCGLWEACDEIGIERIALPEKPKP